MSVLVQRTAVIDVGDDAPDFTASLATDGVDRFRLSKHLGDGPVVLAFFPAAFSSTCTAELCTFRDDLGGFSDLGATVFGVSTDLPHALSAYREEYDLPFGLVADTGHEAVEAYDVVDRWPDLGVDVVAQRAVFVVDADGTVTYRWLADDPGQEPPYDAVTDAVTVAGVDG